MNKAVHFGALRGSPCDLLTVGAFVCKSSRLMKFIDNEILSKHGLQLPENLGAIGGCNLKAKYIQPSFEVMLSKITPLPFFFFFFALFLYVCREKI